MKIKLNLNEDQIALFQMAGSKDKLKSIEAAEALARVIGPVIQKVLDKAGTVNSIFTAAPFGEDDNPSFPLDLYFGQAEGYLPVWSSSQAGGLVTATVEGYQEMKVHTYKLDSAVSFYKKYLRKVQLDALAAGLKRMAQEILVKQELNGWNCLLTGLANALTNGNRHVIRVGTANQFHVDDINNLIVRNKRINVAFDGGTPTDMFSEGITDLFVSPEVKALIRSWLFNPENTTASPNGDESTAMPLPDALREEVWRNGGSSILGGIGVIELNELGISQKYNNLFDEVAGAITYAEIDGTNSATFTSASDEIAVGVDLSTTDAFKKAVITDSDTGANITTVPDDQFVSRSEKLGFYSSVQEGYYLLDCRRVAGLVV